jgi:hypothetical protein
VEAAVGAVAGGGPGGGAVDPAAVRAYAKFHCATRAADYLSDDFVEEDFAFFGKVGRCSLT